MSVLRPMNSSLAAKIAAKSFVVTGELTPPKGTDLTKLFATAELLRGSVDAFNVTESPRARMAMDPRAVGKLLQDRGIEVIVQVTSRDRNRIAMQSDLLGAAALGLQQFRVHGRRLTGGRRPSRCQAGFRSHGLGLAERRPRRCAMARTMPAMRCTARRSCSWAPPPIPGARSSMPKSRTRAARSTPAQRCCRPRPSITSISSSASSMR